MTNFEKYKDEILRIIEMTRSGIAGIKDGILAPCNMINCSECSLNIDGSNCIHNFIKWLYEDDGEELDGCDNCKYECKAKYESPCTKCHNNYTSKFECKPRKTRQDELLKLYPNIRKVNGVIDICPGDLNMYHPCRSEGPSGKGCVECIREYWLQEVE